MEHEKNLDDIGTMANFKLKLKKKWISNLQDNIKACGKFEEHRQFFEGIGTEYLVEAVNNTMKNMAASKETIEQTEDGAKKFLERIVEENSLKTFYDEMSQSCDDKDDLHKYASNIASRTLLREHTHKKNCLNLGIARKGGGGGSGLAQIAWSTF